MPVAQELVSFELDANTDDRGFFSLQHNLNTSVFRIRGILVAVQHQNGNWHTLEVSNSVDNRFWWNDTDVQGVISSSNFHNRPVRVTVLTVTI